jgi:hypothetical protein
MEKERTWRRRRDRKIKKIGVEMKVKGSDGLA